MNVFFPSKTLKNESILSKVAGLQYSTLLRMNYFEGIFQKSWPQIMEQTEAVARRCFPLNFAKFLRTPFSIEHLRWLLLHAMIQSFKES